MSNTGRTSELCCGIKMIGLRCRLQQWLSALLYFAATFADHDICTANRGIKLHPF
jgi:hypothetical protein